MKKLHIILLTGLFISCSDPGKTEQLQKELQQYEMNTEIATKNKATVRAFFKALTAENAELAASLFSKNAKHINPYHSGLFPTGANGKEAIKNYWEPVFPNFDGMTFTIEELYAMENPQIVFVKYTGNIKLKNNAGIYSNNYYSTFKFNDEHEITEYVEIFNPITAAKAFNITIN